MCRRTTPLAVTILITILIGSVTAGGVDPNLAGWWRLDDGTGLRAADSSGNERHGELVDNPVWVDVGQAECLDFGEVLKTLADRGFDRWVTACPGDPIPGQRDPLSEARRSAGMREYLRGLGY